MNPLDAIEIRPGIPGDHVRIRKDWRLSYASSGWAHALTPGASWPQRASELYWQWQTEVVDRLLRDALVWVACWREDPLAIVAWLCADRGVLHYVYVLEPYRRHGVARHLHDVAAEVLGPEPIYTHRSRVCSALPIPFSYRYDPRPALWPQKAVA